jgi:hypothetical protein
MAANIENDRKIPINASRSLQRKGIATILFLVLALVVVESFAEDDKNSIQSAPFPKATQSIK